MCTFCEVTQLTQLISISRDQCEHIRSVSSIPFIYCFWWVISSKSSFGLLIRCSEYSELSHYYPCLIHPDVGVSEILDIFVIQCIDCNSCKFAPWTTWSSDCQQELYLKFSGAIIFQVQTWTNFIVLTMLDGGYSVTVPQLCRLDWNIVQVIIIVRLYAMYQQSRKILVSLVVIFLAVTIVFGVITGKISSDGSESKLWLWIKYLGMLGSRVDFQALRSSSFLVLICAFFLAGEAAFQSWMPSLGYSPLYGRSSHCVSQSGLL
jgi:hypothetical protein